MSKKNKFFADDGWAFWVDGMSLRWDDYIKGHEESCEYEIKTTEISDIGYADINDIAIRNSEVVSHSKHLI